MFDAIAGRYDLLNHLLSAGIDRRWRRRAIAALNLARGECVLDICTGTGDLAVAAAQAIPGHVRVIGVDFAGAMLRVGAAKLRALDLERHVRLVRGDATRLPVQSDSVDAITIAFGIRNVEDLRAAFGEMHRVLRSSGRIALLEFARPTMPIVGSAYAWYLHRVLPRIGRAVSRDAAAYSYLADSIDAFSSPDEIVTTLRQTGFRGVSAVRLTFGTVCLYNARKE
jgi:demethylmenaquinone methyltransferase/2-methoxy-6-polyprenyl-1,4-benzoquinol methylase